MTDQELLEQSKKGVDEVFLYKIGKRNRKQIDQLMLRMMKKAREAEKALVIEQRNV